MGLLESALAMPRAGFGDEYAHSNIFEMAAAYLFHSTKNHPFIDGNKRIGYAAAVVFLHINGYRMVAPYKDAEPLMMKLAAGHVDKSDLARFLRAHSEAILDDD
jgi:death-on-curing protein